MFDVDGNGFIRAEELKRVCGSLGEKVTEAEAENMIRAADQDGDGHVNYEEFMKIMMAD